MNTITFLIDCVTGCLQRSQRIFEILFFNKDIVCIERGNCENADPAFREDPRYFRKNSDERKIKCTLDSKAFPPVLPVDRVPRCVLCPAHKGEFFIGLPDKVKRFAEVDVCFGCQLANRQVIFKFYQFHISKKSNS